MTHRMKVNLIIVAFCINLNIFITEATLTNFTFTTPIQILLQIGQHYEQVLPRYFTFQQSSSLSNLTHQNNLIDLEQLDSQTFQILTKQQNSMVRENELYNYGLSDPDEYFSGNKKIYRFADLKKLIGVLDVIEFNHQVIVLFQSGYYSFYSFQEENQQLTLLQTKRLLSNITNITEFDKLSYSPAALNFWGNFVKSQDNQHLIFIGEEKAFLFNKQQRSFQQLKHQNSLLGPNLQKAIMIGDQIICAGGEKGLQIYTIDLENLQLKFNRYHKPSIVANKDKPKQVTQLSPVDIVYDSSSQKFLVIDEFQGIFWVSLPEEKGIVVLNSEQKGVLVQNCQNLHIIHQMNAAVALCPNLMTIDLQTRIHTFIEDIDFVPTQMTINSSKIYLFSKNNFAIYDLVSRTLQEGVTGYEIDYSLIINQSILTVNKFYISKNILVPEVKTFYVSMDHPIDAQFIGANHFSVVFEGRCSDLLSEAQMFKQRTGIKTRSRLYNTNERELVKLNEQLRKLSGSCRMSQPLIVRVMNSSRPSHILEIILGSLLGAIMVLGGVFYWNQNRVINKNYAVLIQQKQVIKIDSDIQSAYTLNPQGKADL